MLMGGGFPIKAFGNDKLVLTEVGNGQCITSLLNVYCKFAAPPPTPMVGQASSPDIMMTSGDVCPTNKGSLKVAFLLVQSSSIEQNCFGSGYKPEPARTIRG